ncbi:kelch repeat and BTB domain-containing protein 8-like [Cloeon dipterum]|uniref:kelch repeat and BTB domain-containing protein 8-like n=1 Tax=Cloeon dipterum TaxID=197152 RepID=UPI00321FA017
MLETGEEIDETQHQPKFYCNRCKRSEKLLQERLAWYTESLHYDCTLRVGRENPKMFKCHKIVLASSSEAFASMLYTDLVEGGKGKDDPITVDDESITPESFDLAMRYIYGDAENFQTVSIACEIYKFARKYMIEDLMHAAANKIKAAAPHEILQVYETLKFLDKSDKLKDALKTIIVRNTNEVLSSPQWIEAAPSTVLDIFKEPVLKVGSEKHLYEALITWGEKNSETTSNLRPMIDSALKQIRFMTFSPLEFSKLIMKVKNWNISIEIK